MEQVVLIDTSSWIEALRVSGRPEIRERVRHLLLNGSAAWCEMVLVELWNGARGRYEKKKLAELERGIPCLSITSDIWGLAMELARKCRIAGKTVPSTDLVITACALFHRAGIEHCDEHINTILKVHGKKG